MKVLLIDVDSKIPNLALMRLATFHKSKGDEISLIRLERSYYPERQHEKFCPPSGFDKVYCSVIFPINKDVVTGEGVEFGGTGYDIFKTLPVEVEACEPDYSIYPENDISYGFISRGCIRNCYFCFVPKKEGKLRQVSTIDAIVRHKKVKFLDNNFLALPNHKELLQELVQKKICFQFNQGLDIRLIDEENSRLLSQCRLFGDILFAFDSLAIKDKITEKLKILSWLPDWKAKFFCYIHPDMPISETKERIAFLMKHKCLPYVMRDIACWASEKRNFYIDLASWANQPSFFKKISFFDFLEKRHVKQERINFSKEIWENIC